MPYTINFNPQVLRARCLARPKDLLQGSKDYRFIDNGGSVLAVAHVDTVEHKKTFSKAILEGSKCYFSPAMDDRLGVYTILDVLPALGLKYDILLTTDEEIGRTTAMLFVPPLGKAYNWMFSFDRRGSGAVYYQYDGSALDKAATAFFRHDWGSFSDISELEHLGCCGINVGTGYYEEHTYLCHMVVSVWEAQVRRFVAFFNAHKDTAYPYHPDTKPAVKKGITYNYTQGYAYAKTGRADPMSDYYDDPDGLTEEVEHLAAKYRLGQGEVQFCDECADDAQYRVNGMNFCLECLTEGYLEGYIQF